MKYASSEEIAEVAKMIREIQEDFDDPSVRPDSPPSRSIDRVRAGVLEMRVVFAEDGTDSVVSLEVNDAGEWRVAGTGRARRRKGDTRDPVLGRALAMSRAFDVARRAEAEEADRRLP